MLKTTKCRKIGKMKYIKRYWQFVFPILIIFLIWNFSAQNSNESDGVSLPIAAFFGLSNHVMRKIAHFSIYLALGASLANAFRSLNPREFPYLKAIILSFVLAILSAIIDECHQNFIQGRNGNPTDVCIDSLGALTGICLFTVIFCLIKQRIRRAKN